jgi:hypothetical protein
MKKWIICLLLIIGIISISQAGTKKRSNKLSKTTVAFAEKIKQGFNMRVWLSNQMAMGMQAWDAGSADDIPDGFGLEYPTNSGVEHLYGAGPRIGGLVDGVPRVDEGYNGSDARKEFLPEYQHLRREHFWQTATTKLGEPNVRGCDDDNDGKVDEDELDGADNDGDWNPVTDDLGSDGRADQEEASCDGKLYDPVTNPDPAGDNYDPAKRDKCHPNPDGTLPYKNDEDIWFEKNGIPDHGEPNVDEDYGAISDNDLYCAATDTFSRPSVFQHVPMGIKVIQKSYAWGSVYAGAILPFDYWFINAGNKVIKDVYVGFFADIDLGPVSNASYVENNYSAYIESLRTAYIHNPIDRGSTPLGITVLGTPKSLDSLEFIWQWSDFTTTPDPGVIDSAIYEWMSGRAFPGKPIADNQPETNCSDTRFLFSFGKFDEIRPGDTLKISIALISGDAVAGGVNSLKENAEKAIKLFRRGYTTPTALISPKLDYKIVDNSVELTWFPHVSWNNIPGGPYDVWDDSNKYVEQHYDSLHWRRFPVPCNTSNACDPSVIKHICDANGKLPGGRTFTGFRLYRSEDAGEQPANDKYTLLREYTIPDTATLWSIEHLDSTFTDSFLVRGKRYHYVVTAFGIPDIVLLPVPLPGGGVRYDTLRSQNAESDFLNNAVLIDVPFDISRESNKVLVVPNPYRVDQNYTFENGGWEGQTSAWDESQRRVKFIHLPEGEWTLRIFTIAGELISTISNTIAGGYQNSGLPPNTSLTSNFYEYKSDRGEIEWNLMSENRRALASGVYVYSVESKFGTQIDKFVLIR